MKELLKIEIDDHQPVTLTMAGSPLSAAADLLLAVGILYQSMLRNEPGVACAFRKCLEHGLCDPNSPVFTAQYPGASTIFMSMKGKDAK